MLIQSDALDQAIRSAMQRNQDEVIYHIAVAVGGDGCNPIDNMESVLEALDKEAPGTPVCLAAPQEDGWSWFYFIGTEQEVIKRLNNV